MPMYTPCDERTAHTFHTKLVYPNCIRMVTFVVMFTFSLLVAIAHTHALFGFGFDVCVFFPCHHNFCLVSRRFLCRRIVVNSPHRYRHSLATTHGSLAYQIFSRHFHSVSILFSATVHVFLG